MDSLHDFRSRFGARLNHPSGYHRLEVADQPSKQAIRHQRLSLQASCQDLGPGEAAGP